MSNGTEPGRGALPPLPQGAEPTAEAFHRWCAQELERRRARDVDLDEARFRAAVELVLRRLGGGR